MTLPIVVVGCGSIGLRHIRILRALDHDAIVAVDPVAERRAEAAAQGAVVHDRLDEALANGVLAALICTPPVAHLTPARKALAAGAHLFVEKPIAADLAGVDELLAAAGRAGKIVLVGYNLRGHPALRKLKSLLDEGVIGRPLIIRAEFGWYLPQWRPTRDHKDTYTARADQGGGILLDGSHEIDYVRWLIGEIASVTAVLDRLGDVTVDVEDTAALTLRSITGVVAEIHLDCLQRVYSRGCKVVGTDGTIEWEIGSGLRVTTGGSEATERPDLVTDFDSMYRDELVHFMDCVAGRASPRVTGEDARRVLEIALAAKRSAQEGRVVQV